jgi:predicted kinase
VRRFVAGPLFVLVSGPPASGKSTLAPLLARELGLPLVAKDTIKDELMGHLPVPDVEASRQLGRAAVAAMLAVAAQSRSKR